MLLFQSMAHREQVGVGVGVGDVKVSGVVGLKV